MIDKMNFASDKLNKEGVCMKKIKKVSNIN